MLLSSSSPNLDLLSTYPLIHCEDPRRDGISTEFHSSTGCEPKRIELNRILVHLQNQITDDQDDIEEIGVVLQPIISTFSLRLGRKHCDTARLYLEDERLREMLASPLCIQSCFVASRYTEHQHKFSHLPLLCYCCPLLLTQTCCPRIHCEDPQRHGTSTEFHSSTETRSAGAHACAEFWSC